MYIIISKQKSMDRFSSKFIQEWDVCTDSQRIIINYPNSMPKIY